MFFLTAVTVTVYRRLKSKKGLFLKAVTVHLELSSNASAALWRGGAKRKTWYYMGQIRVTIKCGKKNMVCVEQQKNATEKTIRKEKTSPSKSVVPLVL